MVKVGVLLSQLQLGLQSKLLFFINWSHRYWFTGLATVAVGVTVTFTALVRLQLHVWVQLQIICLPENTVSLPDTR